MTRAARATEGASLGATSAARQAGCASGRRTSAAPVATGSAPGLESAFVEEERAVRALLGRAEVTAREARRPAFADRGEKSADRGTKSSSPGVQKSSRGVPRQKGEAASASPGLAGASRGVTSADRGTTGAALASIEPALRAAVAHLFAPSGAGLRPTAPLRVAGASPFAPPCPLPLEREALATASASRGAESRSRTPSTDALLLRGAALGRPISAHDATHEALAASEAALLDKREPSRPSRAALPVPREALLTTRAALPVPREALPVPREAPRRPRDALERRTASPIAESVPRHAVECAAAPPEPA